MYWAPMSKKPREELDLLYLLEDEPVPSHLRDELSLIPFSKVVAGGAIGTTGPFTIGVFGT